jgi:hypothetical protein
MEEQNPHKKIVIIEAFNAIIKKIIHDIFASWDKDNDSIRCQLIPLM